MSLTYLEVAIHLASIIFCGNILTEGVSRIEYICCRVVLFDTLTALVSFIMGTFICIAKLAGLLLPDTLSAHLCQWVDYFEARARF